MKFTLLCYVFVLLLCACSREEIPTTLGGPPSPPYTVSGRVTGDYGVGIEGVEIFYSNSKYILTNDQGYWIISGLIGENTITSKHSGYSFIPTTFKINTATEYLSFKGTRIPSKEEVQIFNWFSTQQLPNGLLESAENGNIVSLYDNALAAMVFMLKGEFTKTEKIFDFFNARISSELTNGVGGFSQLRDRNGSPNNHRWMGDNAWLLIALNNYKNLTGKSTYDKLASALSNWLMSLQDADGGLFAGYNANNSRMNYKVTEGNIDAFNAIAGYTTFHSQLLDFLAKDRWDKFDNNLVAWPTNPKYLYALDLHPWSYLIFNQYPVSSLTSAKRFLTKKTANNGAQIMGYCFDKDKDVVWLEGTGQMAVAFGVAGKSTEKEFYLNEMESVFFQSTAYPSSGGFPYASNIGTAYGSDLLWTGADIKIAISAGAWYLFARYNFNPLAVGRNKVIPKDDMFWIN